MSRFTFFTSLLAAVTILIVAQLVLQDYFHPQNTQTSISTLAVTEEEDYLAELKTPENQETPSNFEEPPEEEILAEDFSSDSVTPGKYLNENSLAEAEFAASTQESAPLKIFSLFDMQYYPPSFRAAYRADEIGQAIGMFTEWEYADEISAGEAFDVLRNKSKVYVDLSINVTNSYGDASFFINHVKKPDEAFLVVRMRNFLYSFAYRKTYHSRVKALISILYPAILDRP